MKHVSVIIPQGQSNISNIESTYQLFNHVNNILTGNGKSPVFDVHLVGLSIPSIQSEVRYIVKPDQLIQQIKRTDLIIIPAVSGRPEDVIDENRELFPWIIDHHKQGAEIACFCVGAFLLAATGLLKNKHCSTHWYAADNLRKLFPDIIVVDDHVLTDDHGIYTSGGALCYFNLLIYLIEKFTDREIAVKIAKSYMIDINLKSQSPFIIFTSQKLHGDVLVEQAQDIIEAKVGEKFSIDQLVSQLDVGRRTLERRFKHATGNSIAGYVQRVKIEAAKKYFETSSKNLNEVMFSVGYSDLKGFRSLFKKITGLPPLTYREKYNKVGAKSG